MSHGLSISESTCAGATDPRAMKLVQPTDFDILAAFDEHGRNVAANLALHLDRDRAYVNTRLPELADRGLLKKIGPAPNTGLYEITASGQRAVTHREQYESAEFDALVRGETEG